MRGRTHRPKLTEALPLLPFLAVVTVFLVIPTVTVIVNAFVVDGAFSLAPHRRAVLVHCARGAGVTA